MIKLFKKTLDQIKTYKVAKSWSKLGPNCTLFPKKEFLSKFKCNKYLSIVPHYATEHFTNIGRVDPEI